jgi:glycosyltransferase involved in cell wall biosynthesis
MRIALFTDTCLPTLNGVARALGLLIEHAATAGHEVALVSPQVSAEPHPGTSLHLQLPSITVPFYRELQAARPWLAGPERRALQDFDPELVHVATEAFVGSAGHRWARAQGVPLVTSYCTNFPDYLSSYGLGWAEGWCWRHLRDFHDQARITFCPSDATLKDLQLRGFHRRMRLWSRGVDAQLFKPERRSERLRHEIAPGADLVLMYVGRIAPEKRVDLLLDSFPRIRARAAGMGRRVALVLVGDGPALDPLKKQAGPDVHFTGYQRGEDLARHYASADLFVFPSDTETFGQVVTEALASGVPVVAPARGGVMDTVIPDETGRLFEPGDANDLIEQVLVLIGDDLLRRRLGQQARSAAERRSWAAIFAQLFDDYAAAGAAGDGRADMTAGDPDEGRDEGLAEGPDEGPAEGLAPAEVSTRGSSGASRGARDPES